MKSKKLSGLLVLLFSMILIMGTLALPASAAKSISKATVSVASAIYTGKTLKPKVTVKLSGKTLSSKYYTLTYKNNKNIGTGTVTVKGKNGYSGSVKKTFKIVPGKVTSVKVTPDTTTAKVSWKAVAGATHYRVDLYTGGKWVKKATTASLSTEIKGLTGYTSYYFRVRAYKKVSGTYYTGEYSTKVKATTKIPAPSTFKGTAAENSITLSWAKVSKANYYQIWIYDENGWSAKTTSKTKYTFSNLKAGKTYYFKMRAYKKSGDTRTYGVYTEKLKVSTLIAPVTSLKVSNITPDTALLSWKASSGADSYIIYTMDDMLEEKKYTTTGTSYTLTGLNSATPYKVTVKAYRKSPKTYSEGTIINFATTPVKISKISLSNITGSSAKVSWTDLNYVAGYAVYLLRLDNNGATLERTLLSSPKTTSYTANNLKGATKYRFEISAFSENDGKKYYGEAAFSEIFTTLPGKVENLKALPYEDRVSLTWTLQSGADGYEVYDGNKKLLKELSADKNIFTIYSLTEGTNYTFYVRSFVKGSDGNKIYGDYTGVSALTGGVKVTGVSFTKKTTSMTAGGTFGTEIKIEPADAKNTAVTYTSSDTSVAMIDKAGKITAVKNGVTKITVTTADGGFTDSFTLRVEEVKLQSVSVQSSYTAYVNEGITIKPTFNPSNVSDQSFTLVGSDYTYTYKGGIFGTSSKTDICKFSDYFFVDNNMGRLVARKATIEPETGNAFSFTVTLKASNNKTATFKISASKRLISVYYAGEDNPWYYGNSARLSADVDSSAGFRADSLIWSTSNKNIATVTDNGTVNCVGTGEVTITATAPVGTKNHSITFYVRPVVKLTKDFFENCAIGQSYQLNVNIIPSSSDSTISFLSSDPDIASVTSDGKVTFKKSGYVDIYISSSVTDTVKAVLTTGSGTVPSGSTSQLLSAMESSANKIKTTMPALYVSNLPTFTNVNIKKEGSFKTEDLIGIFESFASSQSKYIPQVSYKNYPSTDEYNDAYSGYLSAVPVSGQYYTIIPGLEESDIKSLEVIDNGSYTYDIKLTLKDEFMAAPPTKPTSTAHGKVFDILEASYMEMIQKGLSSSSAGMTLKYTDFKQTYNNSSLTITCNKVTGKVTNMKYDMNVHVEIVDLKISMSLITAIDSTVTFDVNNVVNYEIYNQV